ncbi:hypothetical protein SODALDRAFT_355315 [Sodiomyces alkalinus F11]|uniref:Uncharacterized protein n=1 Tax=Sodiomyces alkalinus (strain CBS 110278 / VKM F-3762 / F11) TaxID=1314773 RepID=A0A3N2Q8L3_SODAK|nr:hypothetical protein SODALDRAFT_355315 [Sodiomyces alkalinus F11]ROT43119.1 hypothetical protein SODALDRAFT_355315 [Sodiomyces alkalinus F11]
MEARSTKKSSPKGSEPSWADIALVIRHNDALIGGAEKNTRILVKDTKGRGFSLGVFLFEMMKIKRYDRQENQTHHLDRAFPSQADPFQASALSEVKQQDLSATYSDPEYYGSFPCPIHQYGAPDLSVVGGREIDASPRSIQVRFRRVWNLGSVVGRPPYRMDPTRHSLRVHSLTPFRLDRLTSDLKIDSFGKGEDPPTKYALSGMPFEPISLPCGMIPRGRPFGESALVSDGLHGFTVADYCWSSRLRTLAQASYLHLIQTPTTGNILRPRSSATFGQCLKCLPLAFMSADPRPLNHPELPKVIVTSIDPRDFTVTIFP